MKETPVTPRQNQDARVRTVELVISNLLRAGVTVSLAIVALGLVLMFARNPGELRSPERMTELTHWPAHAPDRIGTLARGLVHLDATAIIGTGLLLLIATPVMRVAVSILAFVYQRDRVFVFITMLVLALLVISFFMGRNHGG